MKRILYLAFLMMFSVGFAVAQQAGDSSLTGCLSGSEGNFQLQTDDGRTVSLQAENTNLQEHVGHRVEVEGSSMDGSFTVQNLNHIAENCESAAMGEQPAEDQSALESGAEQTGEAAETTGGAVAEGVEETGEAIGEAGEATGEAVAEGAEETGEAVGLNEEEVDTAEEQAEATEPAFEGQEQDTQVAQAEQEPLPQADQQQDPAVTAEQEQFPADEQATAEQQQLPQTASPLPLLAVLGLGTLAAGLLSRRKK